MVVFGGKVTLTEPMWLRKISMFNGTPPAKLSRIPLWSIVFFLGLYLLAAAKYPGGTKHDPTSFGFSVLENYWCDLLMEIAYNGEENPGRKIALFGLCILSFGLSIFWYQMPWRFRREEKRWTDLIRWMGCASMIVVLLLFSPFHDRAIDGAGLFGLIALSLTEVLLWKRREYELFSLGLLSFLLAIASLLIWKTGTGLFALPLVQKFAFLAFFIWVGRVQVKLV